MMTLTDGYHTIPGYSDHHQVEIAGGIPIRVVLDDRCPDANLCDECRLADSRGDNLDDDGCEFGCTCDPVALTAGIATLTGVTVEPIDGSGSAYDDGPRDSGYVQRLTIVDQAEDRPITAPWYRTGGADGSDLTDPTVLCEACARGRRYDLDEADGQIGPDDLDMVCYDCRRGIGEQAGVYEEATRA